MLTSVCPGLVNESHNLVEMHGDIRLRNIEQLQAFVFNTVWLVKLLNIKRLMKVSIKIRS